MRQSGAGIRNPEAVRLHRYQTILVQLGGFNDGEAPPMRDGFLPVKPKFLRELPALGFRSGHAKYRTRNGRIGAFAKKRLQHKHQSPREGHLGATDREVKAYSDCTELCSSQDQSR